MTTTTAYVCLDIVLIQINSNKTKRFDIIPFSERFFEIETQTMDYHFNWNKQSNAK